MIVTDIIDSDMPVLLSQVPMKKTNMNLNFKKDTISLIGDLPNADNMLFL